MKSKKVKQSKEEDFSPELQALLDDTRPLSELDLDGLADSIRELSEDPKHVANVCKGIFVEDVLRALDEEGVNKNQLAKKLGKSRQQLTTLLDEDKLNNFTIDTMSKLSTALGWDLFVRLVSPCERVKIDPIVVQTIHYVSENELLSARGKNQHRNFTKLSEYSDKSLLFSEEVEEFQLVA